MKQVFFAALLLTMITMSFTACKKELDGTVIDNLVALKAQAQTEQSMAIVLEVIQEQISMAVALNSGLGVFPAPSCPVVTVSNSGFPATLTIDFGSGCATPKGYQISGIIKATVSGKTDETGTTVAVSLEGLTVNGNAITGQFSLTTTGSNGAAQQNLAFSATNIVVKTKDNQTITITELTGTRTQIEGQSTLPKTGGQVALKDDVFEIAFSGSGTDAEGKAFTLSTATPLRREYDCKYIVSGKVNYSTGKVTKVADYGNGNCDNLLEVTIGSLVKTVELP